MARVSSRNMAREIADDANEPIGTVAKLLKKVKEHLARHEDAEIVRWVRSK